MPLKITASGAISSISSCVVAAALTSPMPPTVAATLMTSEPKESTVPDTMSRLPLAVCVTCVSDLAISATSSSNAPIIATVFIPIRKFLSQHFRLPLSGEVAAEWQAEG